jgi:IS30 family transposase
VSIELRPAAINARDYLGDFECDAVIGKRGGSALQVLVDRKSRRMFLKKVPSLCAQIYSDALIEQFRDKIPPKYRNSMTMDNGAENAMHVKVDARLGIITYFCHPYCASERGTVENRNKAIRRFFPKGTDFDLIPDEYIQWVEDYLNCVPMEILNFLTPDKVWNDDSLLRKAA